MTAHLAIPVPDRLASRPRDRRGYPIPASVHIDEAGRPHFTINDEGARQRHMRDDRCSLCGGKLLRGRWFVGGPLCAFHEHGAYMDPPMHQECARYALQVCPYLAAPSYSKRIDDKTLRDDSGTVTLALDESMEQDRPFLFVAVMATGQIPVYYDDDVLGGGLAGAIRFLRPKRPFSRIEFWLHGRQISEADAMPVVQAELGRLAAQQSQPMES